MEGITSFLLGPLSLFYPLLNASIVNFVYALVKRSWVWMLISAVLLYPDAWYFSGYPPFPWAKFAPVIQVVFAIFFYLLKSKQSMLNSTN